MFTSIDKALVAAIMGILFIVQTYTGFSMAWATPEMIATIIGLITPVDNVQNLSHFSKRAASFRLKEERGHEGRERRQTDGASHQDR